MKKLSVLYFSGTGNTRYVAHYLSKKLSGEYNVSIADICEKNANIDADLILLAFPIYGSSPPIPMRNFVVKMGDKWKNKTVAIAETQYFFSCDGAASLGRTLIKLGADVKYAEHFNMPNNLGDSSVFKVRNGSDNDEILARAERKMNAFAAMIIDDKRHRRGFNVLSHAAGYYLQRKWWRRGEKAKRKALKVGDHCVGCGLCVKNCPVNNLELLAGRALGKGNCVFCYRCVNLCPQKAISIFGSEVKTPYKGINKEL